MGSTNFFSKCDRFADAFPEFSWISYSLAWFFINYGPFCKLFSWVSLFSWLIFWIFMLPQSVFCSVYYFSTSRVVHAVFFKEIYLHSPIIFGFSRFFGTLWSNGRVSGVTRLYFFIFLRSFFSILPFFIGNFACIFIFWGYFPEIFLYLIKVFRRFHEFCSWVGFKTIFF